MAKEQYLILKSSMIVLTIMILGMVAIGGLTRLTGSGLSIVEWKPLLGIFPPLNIEQWVLEFSKYQHSPEFQKINFGMTLPEFQSIYWLEYLHRLFGRLLSLSLLIPTYFVFIKKQHREKWPFVVLLWLLGAGQGLMGWLMVKSGLNHDAHVSPYRLAGHLFLALAIFSVALWMTFSLFMSKSKIERNPAFQSLSRLSSLGIVLVLMTAFLGALVAGLKAGLVYNTFPYMGESIIPREFLTQNPWWSDLFENPVSVQFLHRVFAVFTVLYCVGLWVYQQNLNLPISLRIAFTGVAISAIIQVLLGIGTLLLSVPIGLATLHQSCAFILFGFLLATLFLLKHR